MSRLKLLRKNGWKLILDSIMLVLLALMYSKHAFGLAFHEIGGLVLCGLFILHQLFNLQWIKAVTKGLSSRRTPTRQKIYWVLDILLLCCFTYILVSGILISKVVFPGGNGSGEIKIAHYGVSALALMLMGIHFGLHIGWISRRIPLLKKLPALLRRSLAVVLSVAVFAFGVYQFTSTSVVIWLSNFGTVLGSNVSQLLDQIGNTEEQAGNGALLSIDGNPQTETEVSGKGNNGGNGAGRHDGTGPHGSGGLAAQGGNAIDTVLRYLGLLFAFAVVTAWVDGSLKRMKRKHRLHSTQPKTAYV